MDQPVINNQYWRRWSSGLLCLGVLLSSLLLFGCQGGGGSDSAAAQGEVVIGLTDAAGDFSTYTVDVLSLTLTRANGAVVETLPVNSRIDFARYTDMTEFVTAATIPNGRYVRATMTLDYQHADIQVEDPNGNIVPVSTFLDADGNPVTTLQVSVVLEGKNSLVIVPGVPAHMTLDFDLGASNKVEFDAQGVPTQTIAPTLFADAELTKPKAHRARGLLDRVAPDENRFAVIMRPLRQLLAIKNDHRFGVLQVSTSDTTLYEIDGQSYQGSEGLRALDALPSLSAVVVIGDLQLQPRRFHAREVYAGSSVPGGTLDVVSGNVIKRETTSAGDVLTIKGATLFRADGSIRFHDEVRVLIADTTRVKRQLSTEPHVIGDISIGQRVTIYGDLLATDTAATAYEMDATQGLVRMKLTTLRGTVAIPVVIPSTDLVVDLQRIDRRRVAIFDFTGTGIDPTHDADPTNYEVDTATLDASPFVNNEAVLVRGFVAPFGQAPADFNAQTLVHVANVSATMAINWRPASATAITALGADGIVLDMNGTGKFHYVRRAGVLTDLNQSSNAPSLAPETDLQGHFLIIDGRTTQLHTRFDRFVDDLRNRLDRGALVAWLRARGRFDDRSASLTSRLIKIKLK